MHLIKAVYAFPAIVVCFLYVATDTTSAQELRYRWQPNQKFSYNVTVVVDQDDVETTFSGTIHYEVNASNAEQSTLTYRGGLNETTKNKPNRQQSGGFGPPGFGGPRGFGGPMGPRGGPFARPTFAGKVQTTNRITLTSTGNVLAMEGDSHLPFLLGNVSLMPFETLPKDNQREWVVDTGASISEADENPRGFGFGGPFGPRMGNAPNKSVQAASEVSRYSIQQDDGNLVSIRKSYQLISPGSDGESFDMSGAGTWVFNKREAVAQAIDLSLKLITKEGNSSTTFPITLKLQRLSAEDLARMEAEAKRLAEETKRKADEAKALAEAPLTDSERREALAALANKDVQAIKATLTKLETKSPKVREPQVETALRTLLKHRDAELAELAARTLAKWSPEFKKKFDLNKAYEGPSPVESTNLEVDSTTKLRVGQIVQIQESGSFWFPAKIKELVAGGKVKVDTLTWGKPGRELTLMRRQIQLAPPEVDQPKGVTVEPTQPSGDDGQTAVETPRRKWADKTGRFKIDASFVALEDGTVELRRADGRTVKVPLAKLSQADQDYVQQMLEENPFEVK